MTPPPEPRIAVIGPGAIGTTVAALLHEAGAAPFVAGRSARSELRLESAQGTLVVPGPIATDPGGVHEAFDVVFLAVKATQTDSAGDWLAALCGPGTVVCVLQNGVEQRDRVAPLVPGGDVVPAVVWFPAVRGPDDAVRLLADPRLTLPDTPGGATVAQCLRGTHCRVELAEDFPTVAWRKLLQNAAAGLMAVTGRRAGMFARDDIGGLTLDYLAECRAVARADGARLDDDEPRRILDAFRASPADRGTSILADRDDGRPLEWDIRNGVVQRRGRALGIPTPISDILVPLLAAISDGPG
jgi:2-dehydropantoate 2-reductase